MQRGESIQRNVEDIYGEENSENNSEVSTASILHQNNLNSLSTKLHNTEIAPVSVESNGSNQDNTLDSKNAYNQDTYKEAGVDNFDNSCTQTIPKVLPVEHNFAYNNDIKDVESTVIPQNFTNYNGTLSTSPAVFTVPTQSSNSLLNSQHGSTSSLDLNLQQVFVKYNVGSAQELKELQKKVEENHQSLKAENEAFYKIKMHSIKELDELEEKNRLAEFEIERKRKESKKIIAELQAGNQKLQIAKKKIGHMKAKSGRIFTNVDKDQEELNRREPGHLKLKSTFENSLSKKTKLEADIHNMTEQIKQLSEKNNHDSVIVASKTAETVENKKKLMNLIASIDETMGVSLNNLSELLNTCIAEQHALDMLNSFEQENLQSSGDL
ncbi:hypothetical protein HDU92_003471 [Lobulomyces angularis]|nr:hypothetical protein HDU92_003471 [Lobulomyces angularis]